MKQALQYQVLGPMGTLRATVLQLEAALFMATFAGDGATVVRVECSEYHGGVVWTEGIDGDGAAWRPEIMDRNLELALSKLESLRREDDLDEGLLLAA